MCNLTPVQNHSLRNAVDVGSIINTTTKYAVTAPDRQAVFFYPNSTNPITKAWGFSLYLSLAEFVARAIGRNKPSNRTNNASRSYFAVVEPLLHPYGRANLFTKQNMRLFTMKTTPKPTALAAFSIVFNSTKGGKCYA
ncbi:hypothetical protein EDC44_10922 [Cricetibacter osteomyelitidis]|uniref:Uncharacterized protein n=1 Tax=Cricetibacter osteomyelitidis TaxID=1521931 RepID=A0A4R2T1U0_9PAST|nr:hypothetical protein [Cricetibacter osteomyelitidis]TCP95331.1 hypothetical protein EDC44_10922 [Cricetibacter osteomyelitidis]